METSKNLCCSWYIKKWQLRPLWGPRTQDPMRILEPYWKDPGSRKLWGPRFLLRGEDTGPRTLWKPRALMRGPRTQESLKTQDIGLYKASKTRALLRRTRIQEPKMIPDPDFYRELCFSIFSNGLVTSYFEEHLKLAVFVQPVSSVLFTSIRVQQVMHNNFMNILSFLEHMTWYLSQQLL